MLIVVETIIVFLYMIDSKIGVYLMLFSIAYILSLKDDPLYNILSLLIMSLPLSFIGFYGMEMHQMFSWYNILLIMFLFKVYNASHNKLPLKKRTFEVLVLILVLLLMNFPWNIEGLQIALMEVIQVFLMILPVTIMFESKGKFAFLNGKSEKCFLLYADVCVATAICLLLQFVAFRFAGIVVGNVQFLGIRRVQYQVLFKGASILPIFLGVGAVILFIRLLDKKIDPLGLVKFGIIFAAMFINSSRTGIMAAMIVFAWISLIYIIRKPNVKLITLMIFGFGFGFYGISYISSLRSINFLDENGRIVTLMNGIRIWLKSPKNFFLGEGFAGEWQRVVKPHNVVVQTLAQCGIVISVIILIMAVKYLNSIKNNKYKYVIWFITISGMFVTDFYANAFTTIALIIVGLSTDENYEQSVFYRTKNKGLRNGKRFNERI